MTEEAKRIGQRGTRDLAGALPAGVEIAVTIADEATETTTAQADKTAVLLAIAAQRSSRGA